MKTTTSNEHRPFLFAFATCFVHYVAETSDESKNRTAEEFRQQNFKNAEQIKTTLVHFEPRNLPLQENVACKHHTFLARVELFRIWSEFYLVFMLGQPPVLS